MVKFTVNEEASLVDAIQKQIIVFDFTMEIPFTIMQKDEICQGTVKIDEFDQDTHQIEPNVCFKEQNALSEIAKSLITPEVFSFMLSLPQVLKEKFNDDELHNFNRFEQIKEELKQDKENEEARVVEEDCLLKL